MKQSSTIIAGLTLAALLLVGCGESGEPSSSTDSDPITDGHAHDDEQHDHDHDHDGRDGHAHDDHEHDEAMSLGTAMVGDMEIECWQNHGEVEPGKEMHLVVKLPHSDDGQTVVRAWIGTEDRLTSIVGKGEYAPSHDDYDVHAVAPDPLPDDAAWWIEVEKPDGTRAVGSIAFN